MLNDLSFKVCACVVQNTHHREQRQLLEVLSLTETGRSSLPPAAWDLPGTLQNGGPMSGAPLEPSECG